MFWIQIVLLGARLRYQALRVDWPVHAIARRRRCWWASDARWRRRVEKRGGAVERRTRGWTAARWGARRVVGVCWRTSEERRTRNRLTARSWTRHRVVVATRRGRWRRDEMVTCFARWWLHNFGEFLNASPLARAIFGGRTDFAASRAAFSRRLSPTLDRILRSIHRLTIYLIKVQLRLP